MTELSSMVGEASEKLAEARQRHIEWAQAEHQILARLIQETGSHLGTELTLQQPTVREPKFDRGRVKGPSAEMKITSGDTVLGRFEAEASQELVSIYLYDSRNSIVYHAWELPHQVHDKLKKLHAQKLADGGLNFLKATLG